MTDAPAAAASNALMAEEHQSTGNASGRMGLGATKSSARDAKLGPLILRRVSKLYSLDSYLLSSAQPTTTRKIETDNMASQEDTDDLYADLYGGDGGGDVVDLGGDDKADAADEQDLIGYDEDDTANAATDNAKDDQSADKEPAPNGGSFIPPPTTNQQQGGGGMQIKGSSFIPPPTNSYSNDTGIRDLTPSNNNASSTQHDASYQQHSEGNGNEHGADAGQSDNRAVMPHEMPEEG